MSEAAPAAAPTSTPAKAPSGGPTAATPAVVKPSSPVSGGGQPKTSEPAGNSPAPEPEIELNIYGKKEKWPLSKAKARLEREMAADRRFMEASQKEKAADALRSKLKTNAWEALREAGMSDDDISRLATERVYQEYQRHQMTPEQQAYAKMQAERDAAQAELRKHTETATQRQARAAEERATQEYINAFEGALSKIGIEPKPGDPTMAWAVSEMARLEAINAEAGFSLSPDQLAETLQESMGAGFHSVIGKLTGEPLLTALDRFSPGLVDRVNEAVIAKYTHGQATGQPKRSTPSRSASGQFQADKPELLSKTAWRKSLDDGM